MTLDDLRRFDRARAGERMPDRAFDETMLLEPAAGPPVQHLDLGRRPPRSELGTQQLLKHVMVAKPLIERVERNTEQPFSLQQVHEPAPVELTR